MKDRYCGDINDYYKYGLIRGLTNSGKLSCSICWMLTPDDGNLEGGKLDYLLNPTRWSGFDEELFSALREMVVDEQKRGVRYVRERNLISSASYFEEFLTDDQQQREQYMERFMNLSPNADLLFFDPDNGMEVASVPPGHKGSSKYLYWDEIRPILPESLSILVYQHFPRVERQGFIDQLADRFLMETGYSHVLSFRTTNVVFFLLVAQRYLSFLEGRASAIKTKWREQFKVETHSDV